MKKRPDRLPPAFDRGAETREKEAGTVANSAGTRHGDGEGLSKMFFICSIELAAETVEKVPEICYFIREIAVKA